MRQIPGAIVVVLAVGCYNPQNVTILCPSTSPECPPGQVCRAEVCVSADLDMAQTSDSGSPDLAAGAKYCRDGLGKPLGPKAEACSGTFAKGGAASLCDTGYAPCVAATAAGIDLAACAALPGAYVADVGAYWVADRQLGEKCGTAVNNQLLYGCGGGSSRPGVQLCAGLPRVVEIGSNGWTGGDGSLAQVANTDPAQGVLCCRP
jgi:hypothetical protein